MLLPLLSTCLSCDSGRGSRVVKQSLIFFPRYTHIAARLAQDFPRLPTTIRFIATGNLASDDRWSKARSTARRATSQSLFPNGHGNPSTPPHPVYLRREADETPKIMAIPLTATEHIQRDHLFARRSSRQHLPTHRHDNHVRTHPSCSHTDHHANRGRFAMLRAMSVCQNRFSGHSKSSN